MRGIVIPFTADPRQFVRGIRQITTSLDDVTDAFDEVERSGKDMADGIEDAFRDVGTKASRQLDDLPRRARKAADDTSDEMRRGVRGGKLGEVGAEVGDEFVESWGEAVRSGNPGAVVGEVFSNAAMIGAVAGPAGAVAGLAATAAVTFFRSFAEKAAEKRAAIRQAAVAVFDVAAEAQEEGKKAGAAWAKGLSDRGTAEDRLVTLLQTMDKSITTTAGAFAKIESIASNLKVPVEQVLAGLLGNKEAALDFGQALNNLGEPTGNQKDLWEETIRLMGSGRTELEKQKGLLDTSAALTDVLKGGYEGAADAAGNAAGKAKATADATRQAADDAGRLKNNINGIKDKTVHVKVLADLVASGKPGGATAAAILRGDTRF